MCGILIESRRFHREETKEKEQERGKKKERKKEKESEEALIKPAARRVIKTRARPREREMDLLELIDTPAIFQAYARRVIGIW